MAKGNHYSGDNMRNVYFKSRTFVFIGILLLGFAAFSFWGLSTQNSDLLVKIQQLEDNVNIGSRKLVDLEDELAASHRKNSELQKSNAKLQSDLTKKESLINAQGGEAAQWRDRVRDTETEVAQLKSQLSDKLKELTKLQGQVEAQTQELSLKDSQLRTAQEALAKLQAASDTKNAVVAPHNSNLLQSSNQSSTISIQSGGVLAKPDSEANENKIPERYQGEPVGAKPEEEPVIKPDEEMELMPPNGQHKESNKDQPDNDEAKFKEIQAEVEVGDDPVEDKKDGSKEQAIKEPNLLNSMGDNLDDDPEPALVEGNPPRNPRFHNLNPRFRMKMKQEEKQEGGGDDNNMPEDQEVENEHDDDRGLREDN